MKQLFNRHREREQKLVANSFENTFLDEKGVIVASLLNNLLFLNSVNSS